MLALIDSDILTYRCGFAAEKKIYIPHINGVPQAHLESVKELKQFKEEHEGEEIDIEHKLTVQPLDHCLQMVRTTVDSIQAVVGELCEFYLTAGGRSNFRYNLASIRPYKGNREDARRPIYYDDIRSYLVDRWKAKLVEGWEADDEISIRTYEEKARRQEGKEGSQATVIVSIDKDLDMVEGLHYNWVTGVQYNVVPWRAMSNFYKQLLTGDSVDNIPGIPGVGPKTADKLLDGYTKEAAMWDVVRDSWYNAFPKGVDTHDGKVLTVDDALLEVGRLLWMKRARTDNLWLPPDKRNK